MCVFRTPCRPLASFVRVGALAPESLCVVFQFGDRSCGTWPFSGKHYCNVDKSNVGWPGHGAVWRPPYRGRKERNISHTHFSGKFPGQHYHKGTSQRRDRDAHKDDSSENSSVSSISGVVSSCRSLPTDQELQELQELAQQWEVTTHCRYVLKGR